MKVINKLFAIGCGVLTFAPGFVKADIASPGRSSINAYISNASGASACLDLEMSDCINIPYGKEVTIEEFVDNNYSVYYDNQYYYVSSSDCTFSDTDKFSFKTLKATYHTMSETKIYSMPFFNSDVVGTIPKDKDIKLMQDPDKTFDNWKYVNYGDLSGWVYVIGTVKEYYNDKEMDSTIVVKESGKIFIALPSATLYTDYQAKNIADIVLDYGDVYEYDYLYDLYYDPLVRIKVGDKYYWTVKTNQGYESGVRIYNLKTSTKSNFTLYKKAYDKSSSITKTINEFNIYNTIYTTNTFIRDYDCWALIEVDGEKLWALITMDENYDFAISDNLKFTFNGERTLYSYADLKTEIGTLTKGTYYGSFLSNSDPECIYIEGKGFVSYYNSNGNADDITYESSEEDIYEDEEDVKDVVVDLPLTADNDSNKFKMNSLSYVIIGISLAVFAGVTILIINKKKNRKNKKESLKEINEVVNETTTNNSGVDNEEDNTSSNE